MRARRPEQVLGILTDLFERADPNKHPGGDTLRVTSLLDAAEEQVGRLGNDPARQAALWRAVGRMRAARGEFQRGLDLLTRAYELRRRRFGPQDVDAARIHHEIARVLVSYRGEDAARPVLDSSLTELRRLLGDDHEDVRTAMGDLFEATYDSVAARALLDRLLELERRSPTRDPVALANRLEALGAGRFGQQRYDEAVALFQAGLDLLRPRLPAEHELVSTLRQDLALALQAQGSLVRAESLQRAEVALEDRYRAPALSRAAAREALAITIMAENRFDAAEPVEREALRLFREGTAPGHWRVWSALRNLAFIAAARGRAAEGLALLDSAIALAGAGPTPADAGYLTAQRVQFLVHLNRLPEAAQAISDAERALGASPTVGRGHRADVDRYAAIYHLAGGQAARAKARLRAAISLSEPDVSPGINHCLLGVALARLERFAEARPLLDTACSAYQRGFVDPMLGAWIAQARERAGMSTGRTGGGPGR